MKRSLLSALAVGLFMTANVISQVPSYVPTNGLVAWYPFDGNSDDLSVLGNHPTNAGAELTLDRFNNCNSAYHFGPDAQLFKSTPNTTGQNFTWSFWMKKNNSDNLSSGMSESNSTSTTGGGFSCTDNIPQFICQGISTNVTNSSYVINLNTWYHFVVTKSNNTFSIYINGQLNSTGNSSYLPYNNTTRFILGSSSTTDAEFDDIGMWNSVLNSNQISALYNATSTGNSNQLNIAINSSIYQAQLNQNVQLIANSNLANVNYQWETNPSNVGWQHILPNSYYSGITTNTLNLNNVQLANHSQPFRVIASLGNCIDTSNIATIQITDTCLTNVTVYDTLLTAVTDTLIINTTLSLPAPNNENTILVYPNPTSDHITIDNGNFSAMSGYSIKIENNAGQQVFQSAINQAQFYVDLSTWSGNGLYFVHLIDPQNNTVTVRKIVLQ